MEDNFGSYQSKCFIFQSRKLRRRSTANFKSTFLSTLPNISLRYKLRLRNSQNPKTPQFKLSLLHRALQPGPQWGLNLHRIWKLRKKMWAGYVSSIDSVIYKISVAFETLQMEVTTEMPNFSITERNKVFHILLQLARFPLSFEAALFS